MGITVFTKCNKCGKIIAVTKLVNTEDEYKYVTKNRECRFIDKWGFARNFCKDCMK